MAAFKCVGVAMVTWLFTVAITQISRVSADGASGINDIAVIASAPIPNPDIVICGLLSANNSGGTKISQLYGTCYYPNGASNCYGIGNGIGASLSAPSDTGAGTNSGAPVDTGAGTASGAPCDGAGTISGVPSYSCHDTNFGAPYSYTGAGTNSGVPSSTGSVIDGVIPVICGIPVLDDTVDAVSIDEIIPSNGGFFNPCNDIFCVAYESANGGVVGGVDVSSNGGGATDGGGSTGVVVGAGDGGLSNGGGATGASTGGGEPTGGSSGGATSNGVPGTDCTCTARNGTNPVVCTCKCPGQCNN